MGGNGEPSNPPPFSFRTPNEILAMTFDDSDRILGDRLLSKGQSLTLLGEGGIGKSRLGFQMIACQQAGRKFLIFETWGRNMRWLVLQAENANRRLRDDMERLHAWLGADWPSFANNVMVHTLETDSDGLLSLEFRENQLRTTQAIQAHKPDGILWDPLGDFGIGDLNKDADMRATCAAISRLSRAGNPERAIVVSHHALTGKAGAAKSGGYDRGSFGRNSKVLHSWTRGQINIAPGSPDNAEELVLTCGKCSNGKPFSRFAVRLNPDTMIYEVNELFDFQRWEAEVTGSRGKKPLATPDRVRELCRGPMGKAELAKAIEKDTGVSRATAYRHAEAACKAKTINWNKETESYAPAL
jgi:hypothetical protein